MTTSTCPVRRPISSSRRSRLARTAQWRWRSTIGACHARATPASFRQTSGGRTSASTRRCRPTRTAALGVGGNVRISECTWDPEQPGQHLGGLSQYPCAGARDPCPNGRGFIGDYFGLAISGQNIYALMVSTHDAAPGVTADEGGSIYYQQQVLATVPRSAFGL